MYLTGYSKQNFHALQYRENFHKRVYEGAQMRREVFGVRSLISLMRSFINQRTSS